MLWVAQDQSIAILTMIPFMGAMPKDIWIMEQHKPKRQNLLNRFLVDLYHNHAARHVVSLCPHSLLCLNKHLRYHRYLKSRNLRVALTQMPCLSLTQRSLMSPQWARKRPV